MRKVMFVGQAMPRVKRNPHDWPTLNKWLYQIGLTDQIIKKHFLYSALVDYFPGSKNGSHLVPTAIQIEKEEARLAKQLREFDPDIVVAVGKMSICRCLGREVALLSDVVGKQFKVNPFQLLERRVVVIPLPHPSGASTWRHGVANMKRLQSALSLLKSALED